MAGSSTGNTLVIDLGLDLSQLESGFVAANRTVSQNMARLQRESNLIQLRAEVEIGNLDETADALQILTIRENALNQQMQIQRDRIRIAEAAYQNLNQTRGAGAAETQRAEQALQRERLALQRLQRSLDDLHSSSNNANQNVGGLNDLFADFGGKAGMAAAGIAALTSGINLAASSSVELIEKFRELQKQAYDLNMSFSDSKNFLRHMNLAGGDYGDFEGYIRGITDAYVKGEADDSEFIALSKYGAKITDATGKLKDFKDITEEVYQAWKKADAAGEGIEFLQLTGGEAGIRDAIQYFQRYEEAKEDAAKVFDSGINPDELHKSERALNLLTEQTGEFKDALINVITPTAQASMEQLFEIFHSGTQFLVDNKAEFQRWGFIATEAIKSVSDLAKELNIAENLWDFSNMISPAGLFTDSLGNLLEQSFGEDANERLIEYNNAINAATNSWADFRQETEKVAQQGNPLNQYDTKRITQFRDEIDDLRLELEYADNEIELALKKNDLWLERELTRKNYLSSDEEEALLELHALKAEQIEKEKEDRITEIREQAARDRRTNLENTIADIEKEKDAWVSAGMEEAEAVELAQQRINQAREDALQKALDLVQESADIEYKLTHDAFENQLYDIERWKDAQIEKAETAEEVSAIIANAAMKEAEAFEREMDRIKGKIETLQDKIFAQEHNRFEVDMRKAQKEYEGYLEEGIYPRDMVDRWYQNEQRAIRQRAAEAAERQSRSSNRNNEVSNYSSRPSNNYGTGYTGYFIDFNEALNQSTQSLAELDAEQIARKATEEKMGRSAAEIESAFNGVDLATSTYNDVVKNMASQSEAAFEKIRDINVDDFQSQIDAAAGNIQNLGDATERSSQRIESASETFNRAMDISRAIEEQRRSLELQENFGKNSDVYGNDDVSKSIQDWRNAGVDITYGDIPETLGEFGVVLPKTVEGLIDMEQALQLLPDYTRNVVEGMLEGKIQTTRDTEGRAGGYVSGDEYMFAVSDFSRILEGLGMTSEQVNTQLSNMSDAVENFNSRYDGMPGYQRDLEIGRQHELQARGNQTITIAPNVNIDLGGAYVFDDSMKAQLTDDITREVANAVTDAVSKATSQVDYGYGN